MYYINYNTMYIVKSVKAHTNLADLLKTIVNCQIIPAQLTGICHQILNTVNRGSWLANAKTVGQF